MVPLLPTAKMSTGDVPQTAQRFSAVPILLTDHVEPSKVATWPALPTTWIAFGPKPQTSFHVTKGSLNASLQSVPS